MMNGVRCPGAARRSDRGFTLVELMVALGIGTVILGAMAVLFAVTSSAREELERHSRQIENGRYATERVREEVRLAGFFGEVLPAATSFVAIPAADACNPTFGWSDNAVAPTVPTSLFGIRPATPGAPISCVANAVAGSDVLVIRRVSTAETTTAAATNGALYLQTSFCQSDAKPFAMAASPSASFILRPRYCGVVPAGSPALAPLRRVHLTVYYVASCNVCSGPGADSTPTLKRVEYTTGSGLVAATAAEPLVEGIERLQIEYGIDADGDGAPDRVDTDADAVPDSWYVTAAKVTDWSQVVSMRVFVLSRGQSERPENPVDTRTYVIGTDGTTVGPFNDRYRRQLMSTVVQVGNVANWRETN